MRRTLVATRGEIALRIMRTCQRAGIETVAVYSGLDARSPHARAPDFSVAIGPAAVRSIYLIADKPVDAARRSGAEAIHSGYGFLSEHAAFAWQVVDAGLIWIRPRPDTIAAMGDKARGRGIAMAAGVPVLPSTPRFAEITPDIRKAVEAIGFPLLVTATGIGMRRVDSPEQMADLARAKHDIARRAFSVGEVYLERFVKRGRHVEVQVFGFGDGSAVHFYESDCSLQRRFQKVIEESPALRPPEAVYQGMAEVALWLARQERYADAGTVDLVVLQIDLARGAPLQREQSEIKVRGAARVPSLCRKSGARLHSIARKVRALAHAGRLGIPCASTPDIARGIRSPCILIRCWRRSSTLGRGEHRPRRASRGSRQTCLSSRASSIIAPSLKATMFNSFIDAHRSELIGC